MHETIKPKAENFHQNPPCHPLEKILISDNNLPPQKKYLIIIQQSTKINRTNVISK